MAGWLAVCVGACNAPELYRHGADRVAYNIVTEKQKETLGRTEPFSIDKPAETLRKRLMLDQLLPHATPASLGTTNIEPIEQWPDDSYLTESADDDAGRPDMNVATLADGDVMKLTLVDALRIGAYESREYQDAKEQVFEDALRLDLERDAFRNTWAGTLQSLFRANPHTEVVIDDRGNTEEQTVSGAEYGGVLDFSRRFVNGMTVTGMIGLDLVSLLTQNRMFSRGVFADASITIPLLRGSGEFIVKEPLTQAQRDVIYAIYRFERFKREFVVDVATEYLNVLRQLDAVDNARENYRSLIASTRRARRLADAGRLPEIQVDQSWQNELRARNQWVSAQESYQRQLDGFKLLLGLPADARVELDRSDLETLAEAMGDLQETEKTEDLRERTPPADAPIELAEPGLGAPGRYEMDETVAIVTAIDHRLDLRIAVGRILDSQRSVAVAADQLRADVTLLGQGSAGERRSLANVDLDTARLRPHEGQYSALLSVDLPLERTAERNAYRTSLIRLEQTVRDAQALEDQIKLAVRNGLRRLLEARESIQIQAQAVAVAQRRVASTNLFLEAGRAEIRDLLEAQDALLSAQNALTAALVNYRVGELSLQRDLGVLEVNERGEWTEYTP